MFDKSWSALGFNVSSKLSYTTSRTDCKEVMGRLFPPRASMPHAKSQNSGFQKEKAEEEDLEAMKVRIRTAFYTHPLEAEQGCSLL